MIARAAHPGDNTGRTAISQWQPPQKHVVPVPDHDRVRIVLRRPFVAGIPKALPDPFAVHVAEDDHVLVLRRILDNDLDLIALAAATDLSEHAEMHAVHANRSITDPDRRRRHDALRFPKTSGM